MLKWKWFLIAAGASLVMYGCSAKEAAAPPAQTQAADTADVQSLYKLRNPLIGDVPADGRLVDAVKQQFGIKDGSTMELMTEKEPYELMLHFKTEPDSEAMKKAAAVLISLIDNCGIVSWDYPGDQSEVITTLSVDAGAASKLAGVDDIKSYSHTLEKMEELLSLLNKKWDAPVKETAPVAEASQTAPDSGFG